MPIRTRKLVVVESGFIIIRRDLPDWLLMPNDFITEKAGLFA